MGGAVVEARLQGTGLVGADQGIKHEEFPGLVESASNLGPGRGKLNGGKKGEVHHTLCKRPILRDAWRCPAPQDEGVGELFSPSWQGN
ncbi:hypothetical protein ROS1_51490 [Roseibium sp. ROS1]